MSLSPPIFLTHRQHNITRWLPSHSLVFFLLPLLLLAFTPPLAFAQETQTAIVLRNANLRVGPGMTFAIAGSAQAGDTVRIVGGNPAGDWFELDSGHWIAAFLVHIEAGASMGAGIPPGAVPAQVVHITDGDTIRVRVNGVERPVRYILINTPEADQPFGAEATAVNRRLVGGKTVYLLKDVSETDRFNRLLRYVFLPDGTHVNAELVRQGYAQVATYPPDISRLEEMRAAEAEARSEGRGLWAAGTDAFGAAGATTTTVANLRSGPGTGYAVVRTAAAGTELALVGRNATGAWLQTAENLWVSASLVGGAPTNLPVVESVAPNTPQRSGEGVAPATTPVPSPVDPHMAPSVQLIIVVNSGSNEILEIRNTGVEPLDISRWRLDGSKGDDYCIIPNGVALDPGAGYQVATGDSQPRSNGMKCGAKPIWNNGGETIYLHGASGLVLSIESARQ